MLSKNCMIASNKISDVGSLYGLVCLTVYWFRVLEFLRVTSSLSNFFPELLIPLFSLLVCAGMLMVEQVRAPDLGFKMRIGVSHYVPCFRPFRHLWRRLYCRCLWTCKEKNKILKWKTKWMRWIRGGDTLIFDTELVAVKEKTSGKGKNEVWLTACNFFLFSLSHLKWNL